MDQTNMINTKSIPSFTILLPVISLISVTLFVLLMINGIKNDLLKSDAKQKKILQEITFKKELKSVVDQAAMQTVSILEIEAIKAKKLLKYKLDNMLKHINQYSDHHTVITKDHINKHLNIFNKAHPLLHISIISKTEANQHLTPIQRASYIKKGYAYLNEVFSYTNEKSTLKYIKSLKNFHFLITLDRKKFLNKHAHDIAVMLKKINSSDYQAFNIQVLDKNNELQWVLKNDLQQSNKSFKDPQFIKKILQENEKGAFLNVKVGIKDALIYARVCTPLHWIISVQSLKESATKINSIEQENKATYFEKKTEELLVVIVIVASFVLMISVIVAKIINNIFTKFKRQIEEQNRTLKSFNKELSYKVSEQTRELQESENRYRTIFERSRDGVIILDDQYISYCNESTLKMFGIHLKTSLIGMPISQLFPLYQPDGTHSAKLLHDYFDITAALGHSRFEVLMQKANKQTFYADVWLQNIELEGKQTVHVVFRDIDFQKNAQEKIKEQHKELLLLNETLEEKVKFEVLKNQEKEQLLVHQSRLAQMGEMISMIAHQWRQPLSAISTSSANMKLLIELDQYNKTSFVRNLDQIDDYIQHLSETINDFRNFFKPDKQTEKTTLVEVVERSLNIIFQSLKGHEITVTVDIKENVTLVTYPHELMQVVLNILKNAQDVFIERDIKERHLNISYEQKEFNHELSFSDNAGGVPDDIINRIFDPYFSTKHQKNGTGLGLYMSRVIITEHCKGSLSVHNTDKGAVFVISLPMD